MSPEGQALRLAREAVGLSQRALGPLVGVHWTFLGDVERGRRPLPERLIALFPVEIRRAVGEAAISAHEAAIERIREAIERGNPTPRAETPDPWATVRFR